MSDMNTGTNKDFTSIKISRITGFTAVRGSWACNELLIGYCRGPHPSQPRELRPAAYITLPPPTRGPATELQATVFCFSFSWDSHESERDSRWSDILCRRLEPGPGGWAGRAFAVNSEALTPKKGVKNQGPKNQYELKVFGMP